jgi:photosystem II stability/assembly factor-like uncharacterized protein
LVFVSISFAQPHIEQGVTNPPRLPQEGKNGWYRQQTGTHDDMMNLSVVNKDTLFVSGGGSLLYTHTGGSVWLPTINPRVAGMHFFDSKTGFVGSPSQPNINKTTDGGKTWTVYDTHIQGVNGVLFKGRDTGFAYNGLNVSKTTDGGDTWSYIALLIDFNDISFSDSRNGCVVGKMKQWVPNPNFPQAGGFMVTNDGGKIWTEYYTGFEDDLLSVCMIDSLNIIAGGTNGRFIKTANGGKTWDTISTGGKQLILDIVFPTPSIGIAVGSGGRIQRTTDSGKTWVDQNSTIRVGVDTTLNIFISSVAFVDTLTGWAACEGGILLHTSDGGKSWVNPPPHYEPLVSTIHPNPVSTVMILNYTLLIPQVVQIVIVGVNGQEVYNSTGQIVENPGPHSLPINTQGFSDGAYLCRVRTQKYEAVIPFTIIR